jgi:protein involved in polysaccharide export with SLBB domain
VNAPGLLEVADSMTALQAIFQAGGPKDSAELHNVVLLRYQGTKEPKYQTLDLKQDLKAADGHHDLVLRPYDIVFVPKTHIASMNQFVREYITQLVPATLTLGVTYFIGLR